MLRPIAYLIVAVVAWLGSPLQSKGQGADPGFTEPSHDPAARHSLSGTVINSLTGEPIRRALVHTSGGSERDTLTDSAGHFEFEGLPATQATVSARKPGFFSEQEISKTPSPPMTFQVASGASPVVIKLVPEGVIFGRILSDNEPVENIQVKLMSTRIADGHKVWELSTSAATDEDGGFRLANLMPGFYYLAVGPGDGRTIQMRNAKARESGYSEVFYPGAPDMASATLIGLAAGQQFEVALSLKPQLVFHVSGEVTGNVTDQGVNLQFVNSLGDGAAIAVRFDPEDGKFQANLPAGTYTIRARVYGNGLPLTASLSLAVNSDVSGVRLALEPALSIPVVMKRETTGAQSRISRDNLPPAGLHLRSSEPRLSGGGDYWANVEGRGKQASLAVRNVEPGHYSVEVIPNGPWYVQSTKCGETDLLREDLTIAGGAQLPTIEVVLRDDTATLTGTVKSDGHAAPASVILVSDKYPRQAKMTFVPAGGQFQFGGLAPGDYRVIAFDRVDGLEYSNPEALSPYLGSANHVTLQPNENLNLPLSLIPLGK